MGGEPRSRKSWAREAEVQVPDFGVQARKGRLEEVGEGMEGCGETDSTLLAGVRALLMTKLCIEHIANLACSCVFLIWFLKTSKIS